MSLIPLLATAKADVADFGFVQTTEQVRRSNVALTAIRLGFHLQVAL
jgi:hypothetical protein